MESVFILEHAANDFRVVCSVSEEVVTEKCL